MDVFNKTYVKNTTVHKLKKPQQKSPVYEVKSDSRRKVVEKLYNLNNILEILVYTVVAKRIRTFCYFIKKRTNESETAEQITKNS